MKVNLSIGCLLMLLPLLSCSTQKVFDPKSNFVPVVVPHSPERWELVWSDDFDGTGLPDTSIWRYEVGGNGWGNRELQYYTSARPENARLEGGYLVITAQKEVIENRMYSSARLITKGKRSMLYGRLEARAKLPKGRGTWPAVWLLGESIKEDGWPLCGEIDVMEHVGFDENMVHGSIHTKSFNHTINTQRTNKVKIPDATDTFHTYAIEWTPTKIDFFVDSLNTYSFVKPTGATKNEWPFDSPHFVILNLAIGGDWGGQKGVDDSIFPVRYLIDYVHVYKRKQ